jgi:hypothetical protein
LVEEHAWHIIGLLVVIVAPIAIIMAMQAYDRRAEQREAREKGVGPKADALSHK